MDIQWFGFGMVSAIIIASYDQPFQTQTIGNQSFKRFGIPMCSVFQCSVFKPLLTEPLENGTSNPSVSLCSVFKPPPFLHFLIKFHNLVAACLDQDRACLFFCSDPETQIVVHRNPRCCRNKSGPPQLHQGLRKRARSCSAQCGQRKGNKAQIYRRFSCRYRVGLSYSFTRRNK